MILKVFAELFGGKGIISTQKEVMWLGRSFVTARVQGAWGLEM